MLSVLPAVAPTDAEKRQKWDIRGVADVLRPPVPALGEVWVDTQFEAVPGQTGEHGDAGVHLREQVNFWPGLACHGLSFGVDPDVTLIPTLNFAR